ncbi:MAG: glycosyltransferase family 2 protein [Microbacterium sp.]
MIVNFNSSDVLADCLASLRDDRVHVVVVENGSTVAGELERCEALLAPLSKATLVSSLDNRGFGAGVNLGVSAVPLTPSDVVWVLNPDTVIPDGAFDSLEQALVDLGDVIVSPVITSGTHGELIWFAGGTLDLRRGSSRHVSSVPEATAPIPCSFMPGAALMCTGRTWEKIGGFREDLFLYWEDADLSLRASDLGIPMFVIPGVRVWHQVGASSAREGKSTIWYYYISRNRLIVCSTGFWSALRILFGPGLATTARLAMRALSERQRPIKKFCAYVAGTSAGLQRSIGYARKGTQPQ